MKNPQEQPAEESAPNSTHKALSSPASASTKRVVSAGSFLAVVRIAVTGSRFLRNLLVARVIAPEDFGIGATFALMAALLNSVSELGLDRKIIQDADGDDPRMQNTVHSMFLLRGVLMSLLMLALAPHAARLFGAADIAWAFRAVAILPMLRSFRHTDVVRFQRKLRFGPVQASEVIAHISVTLVAWPLAKFLGDFSALLWLAIMEAALATAFTHVFAERSYRLGWDVNRVRALIKFGWPLWLNGFLFFAIAQGDRAIVGSHVGLHALGIFAIAAGLARIPMTTAAGIAGQLLLPLMAEVQSNQKKFERRFELVTQLLWLIVGVLFVGIPIAGESLVRFLYGHDYAGAGIIAAWLAAVYGLRFITNCSGLAVMARGDTTASLLTSLCRSSGPALAAVVVVFTKAELVHIAAAGIVGEIFAYIYSCRRLNVRHGMPLALILRPGAIGLSLLLLVTLGFQGIGEAESFVVSIGLAATAIAIYAVSTILSMGRIRAGVMDRWPKKALSMENRLP